MKIKHLDEDVERLVDNYGEYHSLEEICNRIIETAARLRDEAKDSAESKQPPDREGAS
jgi:hypothetical protein